MDKNTAIIEAITEHPLPVIFPDTCAILDIIRLLSDNRVDSLPFILEILKNPKRVHIATFVYVVEEFKSSLEKEIKELKTFLYDLKNTSKNMNELCVLFNKNARSNFDVDFKSSDLESIALAVVDESFQFAQSGKASIQAAERQHRRLRPMKKGKGAVDVQIIEHCLEFSRCLREKGFKEKTLFLTSNIQDFSVDEKLNRKVLHPDLVEDFNAAGLRYTTTWIDACNEIGINPHHSTS